MNTKIIRLPAAAWLPLLAIVNRTKPTAKGFPLKRPLHTTFWSAITLLLLATTLAPAQHFNDTWARPMTSSAWTQLSPGPTIPGARRFFAHGHDTLRNRLIVAGGTSATVPNFFDTWALNLSIAGGETWTRLSTNNPHVVAFRAALYDSLRDRFVAIHANGHIDVLNLTANTWSTPATTGVSPDPLVFTTHSALYDAANDRYVVFGGGSGTNPASFTARVRVLNPTTMVWSDLTIPLPHPTPRSLAGVAYDPAHQRMLLFGGALVGGVGGGGVTVNDTWELAPLTPGTETWTQFNPLTRPLDRGQHAVTFDTARNRMIIFGGLHYFSANVLPPFFASFNDLWAFDGTDWVNLATPNPRPISRRGAAAVYDPVNDRVVIFGGEHVGSFPDIPAEPTGLTATLVTGPAVQLTWTDNADNETSYIVERTCDDGTPQIIATLPANSTTYTDPTLPPCAQITYVVRAASADAISPNSNPATVEPDATPPTITCPADISSNTLPDQCSAVVTFAFSASDDVGVVDSGCSPLSGSVFPKGVTTVTCWAADAAGHTNTCSFAVTVTDAQKPVIICASDLATVNDAGQCGAVVNYSPPVGLDNCSGSTITQIGGLTSGALFPIGTTTNVFKITDATGNFNTCSFTVTVTDAEPPAITCPADLVTGNDPGQCDAVVSYTAPVGTDNCLGATTAQIAGLASGATFPLGVTTNVFQVTDAAGNTSACAFTVTVNDTEPPAIVCPASQIVVATNGCAGNVTFAPPTATDNCGSATVLCAPAPGTVLGPGIHTVTCIATDAAGNTNSCSFTLTVLSPLQVVFRPPLEDDNQANNFGANGADAPGTPQKVNKFKSGSRVPHKIKLLDCAGNDVTGIIGPSVNVRLNVTENAGTYENSTIYNDVPEVYSGVGDPGSLMQLLDHHFHYNLNTTGYESGTLNSSVRFFQSVVEVEYLTAPGVIVGRENAILESTQ